MSTKLQRVEERARKDLKARFTSLAHLLDVPALLEASRRLRKNAAVGVDGVTLSDYEQDLYENVRELHGRLKAGKYRHKPIRRVHIPKEDGKTRPIGVSTTEDKLVQESLRKLLETVYEPLFHESSYGFRPGRGAHDALRAIDRAAMDGEMNYVLEADIQAYFDSVDRKALMEMLQRRVADRTLLRLVGKCLRVGVLDGEEYSEPATGTAQGSVLSPLLGNIYLHHVLDEWFEGDVRPRMKGKARLVRYADDFLIAFELQEDAERVMGVLGKRMGKFGLTLHPEKTRLVPFHKPETGRKGRGRGTVDFLGFTIHWRRTRRGGWSLGLRTRKARLRRSIQAVSEFCRRHRHKPVEEQHAKLCLRLNGHFNYFGVNGNHRALVRLKAAVETVWHKWLNRRSQRSRMKWERFTQMLEARPLPTPRIKVQIWRSAAP